MNREFKKLIFVVILFISTISFGQLYPVQVSSQMIPPYSLKLSDYGTSIREKIIANILMIDINEQNTQVGIKIYIENGHNISIQSSPVIIGAAPLFLEGGIPLRLSNLDLQPYFQLQNIQGISPLQYNEPLPDGLYQFCFEIYDWVSREVISRKSCATAYLVLNDPPILNFPSKGEIITEKSPQNLIFQWTPRHLNATNVEYEFTLVELWDTHMDPQAAFLASTPLYQTTTRANTLLYGPGETPLLPDRNYGWRVKVIVNDGIGETALFRNNGYSEIFHFTYSKECNQPQFVLAESLGINSEKIMWQGLEHLQYNIQYRKKGVKDAVWFGVDAYNEYANIYNLEPGSTYEFKVGGLCTLNGPYSYSQAYEFTTAINLNGETAGYSCGITPEIVITNKELLKELKLEQVFIAGDFPITVKKIEQIGDAYSGAGFMSVPYLGDTKIAVEFENIKINNDFQFIEGTILTAYDMNNWTDPNSIIGVKDEINRFSNDLKNTVGGTLDFFETSINKIREGEMTSEGLESILENIKDELPLESIKELEEIKDKIIELEEALKDAKTDEEKQEIQNQINELNQQYADTIEDVMGKMETLIVKAIEKYYIQNKSQESSLIERYVTVYGEACLSREAKMETVSDLVVKHDVEFEFEGEILITEIPDEIKEVFEVQEKYHLYFITKAIAENKDNAEARRIFIDKALDVQVDLLKTLKESKDNGETDEAILDALILNIDNALKQFIGKYKYDYLYE